MQTMRTTTSFDQEDDWIRVKDPSATRSIQSPVAQGTYRRRMKARLRELQVRLNSHEGQNNHNGTIQTTQFSTNSTYTSGRINVATSLMNSTLSTPSHSSVSIHGPTL
ncbi:hypothetical protein S40288_11642 [Stachybotrys chartarum IBT 40288]|nr:hypothetical protein S40288_11642 [Stachybotrys chartarum IBT 40288]